MVSVVNAVGSGSLSVEIDLDVLAQELDDLVDYDPDKYSGAYLKFDNGPLVTVYRTGKYIITGGDSEDEVYEQRDQFLRLFADAGVIDSPEDAWFSMQNFVCTADLDKVLNLSPIAIGFGLEHVEYEPEYFPGLIYRPEAYSSVVLVFSSGKVVITGNESVEQAEMVFQHLKDRINKLVA